MYWLARAINRYIEACKEDHQDWHGGYGFWSQE